jgi:hypothetical protein
MCPDVVQVIGTFPDELSRGWSVSVLPQPRPDGFDRGACPWGSTQMNKQKNMSMLSVIPRNPDETESG